MKNSGKTNRVEPMDTSWVEEFPKCAAIFEGARWFDFFQKIDGFNLELSYRFAQGLDKNTFSIETLKFELAGELIEEATSIAVAGELWFNKVPFTFNSKDFLLPEVEADWSKGVHVQNFKPKWREAIRILQSYITCEGRFA